MVVADGFVGNVALKMAEGMGMLAFQLVKQEATAQPAREGRRVAEYEARVPRGDVPLDYEEYGGAPLLGVAGVAIIAHGRSNAEAIKNAVRVARQSVSQGLVEAIRASVGAAAPAGFLIRREDGVTGTLFTEDMAVRLAGIPSQTEETAPRVLVAPERRRGRVAAITGMGVVSSLGLGAEPLLAGAEGR